MSRLFITVGFILCTGAFAQDIDYAKQVISQLSSPEYKGRGYVGDGDKITAKFITNEFIKMNANPAFKDSYTQKFSVSVNTIPGIVSVKLNNIVLIPAIDFLVESSCPSVRGTFSIVQAKRADLSNPSKLEEIIRISSTSFLLIDNIERKNESAEQTKKIDDIISFLKNDNQIQIPGIIMYTSDKLTWDASCFQNVRPIIILKKESVIDSLIKIEFFVESKYIRRYNTQNVAALIPGAVSPDSFIVVTAHYDHLGMMGKDTYFPGANDNASGLAMILNLAKHFSENKPKYTMVFVAFSAEELGILGALAFTENSPINLGKIKFMVNFDLAGTGEEGIKVVNGTVYKKEFIFLNQVNNKDSLLPKIESRGKACNSDQCAFDEKGIPGFYIYTLGGIKAYHDIHDRYETLPLTEFTDYCKLMIRFFNLL